MSSSVALAAPSFKTGGAYQSAAFEEKGVACAGKGLLYQILVANKNAAVVYLYLFDNASAASGSLICPPLAIPIGGHITIREDVGMPFANGMYFAASSTQGTYGALGSNDLNVHLQFGVQQT